MPVTPENHPGPGPPDFFVTTRWTLVLAAGRPDSPQATQALEEIFRSYWYALYAFIRRQGRSKEDAEDLVQGFFAQLLDRKYLAGLSPDKGKFRAFLLASLKHYLANDWDRQRGQKRGGHARVLSLDWQDAETRYQIEPADDLSPDKLFDRAWAIMLLERVLVRLRQESVSLGSMALFETLKPFVSLGQDAIPYRDLTQILGMNEAAARVVVHRLRKRYRQLL